MKKKRLIELKKQIRETNHIKYKIIEDAVKQKEQLLNQAQDEFDDEIETAHQNAKQIVKDAEQEVASTWDDMKNAMKDEIVKNAFTLAEQIIGKSVSQKDNDELVKQFIKQLDIKSYEKN